MGMEIRNWEIDNDNDAADDNDDDHNDNDDNDWRGERANKLTGCADQDIYNVETHIMMLLLTTAACGIPTTIPSRLSCLFRCCCCCDMCASFTSVLGETRPLHFYTEKSVLQVRQSRTFLSQVRSFLSNIWIFGVLLDFFDGTSLVLNIFWFFI